jgi:hypothetical protein
MTKLSADVLVIGGRAAPELTRTLHEASLSSVDVGGDLFSWLCATAVVVSVTVV